MWSNRQSQECKTHKIKSTSLQQLMTSITASAKEPNNARSPNATCQTSQTSSIALYAQPICKCGIPRKINDPKIMPLNSRVPYTELYRSDWGRNSRTETYPRRPVWDLRRPFRLRRSHGMHRRSSTSHSLRCSCLRGRALLLTAYSPCCLLSTMLPRCLQKLS